MWIVGLKKYGLENWKTSVGQSVLCEFKKNRKTTKFNFIDYFMNQQIKPYSSLNYVKIRSISQIAKKLW